MSPRTPEANARLRAESRARILDAALRLFARHGYGGASVRMIAREAGVATGLIYAHFEGKEALLRAIFEESMADVRASFAAAEAAPPERRVEALIRASFRIVGERQAFWRLSYGVRMQTAVLEGLGQAMAGWTHEIHRALERYLRAAGVAGAAAEAPILFALIDGVSQHFVLDPAGYPLAEVTERIIARYARTTRA